MMYTVQAWRLTAGIIPWRFGSDHFPFLNLWFVGSSRSSSKVYHNLFGGWTNPFEKY